MVQFNTLFAQYTVDVPPSLLNDSTFVVNYGLTDSVKLPASHYQRFYVCDNATLILNGTTSSSFVRIYLEPSAKVILKDPYFYPTIYMRTGAMLDAFNGMQMISLHRENMAYLTDTANVLLMYDSVHTSINFTYTGWPGASKPCGIAAGISNQLVEQLGTVQFSDHQIKYDFLKEGAVECEIYNMAGQAFKKYSFNNQQGIMVVDDIPIGFYIATFKQGPWMKVFKFEMH